MVKTKKVISAALALALAVGSFTPSLMPIKAAGAKTVVPRTVVHDTKGADKEQFFNFNNGDDPPTLDGSRTTDQVSFRILTNVMEGLARQEYDNGKLVMAAAGATKWTISPDGKVWTFSLRNYKWSDGKQVTAQDYEYAWKRLLDPKTAAEYAYFLYFIKGAEEYNLGKGKVSDVGIKALNTTTFQVTLKRPTAYFDKILAFDILLPQRKDIVTKNGDAYGQDPKKMVFNGPFVISQYQRGSKLVMKKNPTYWDAKRVVMQTVNFKVIKEVATGIQMFQAKQLDRTGATKDWITKLKAEAAKGAYRYESGIDPSSWYWQFNTTKGIFKNAKVRLAVGLSISRERYTKVVVRRFFPAYSLVPKTIMSGSQEFRTAAGGSSKEPVRMLYAKYPNAASWKKLFQDGLKELGMSTDTSKVNITYTSQGADATTRQNAEFIKAQVETALGVNCKIDAIADFGQYLNATKTGNYEFTLAGWGPDYNDPMTFLDMWTTGNDMNKAKYSNKKFDADIKAAQNELNEKKRNGYLIDAEKTLVTDGAIIPFYWRDIHAFVHNYVYGLKMFNFGGDFDFKYAYTKGADQFKSARTR